VPIEQIAAAVSALTHEGVRGSMGGREVAQLLAQIIKNYDTATGLIKNKGATLRAALTPEGGIDLAGTLRNFNEVASRMPVDQAMKFSQAISGTMNAWRLFGSVNPEFLRVLQEKMDDATRATHGLTSEAEALRRQMTTTAVEGERIFKGFFAEISNLVDISPLRGWLHGVADDLQHTLEAMKIVQDFQSGREAYSSRVLAPGANVREAVEHTQFTVRQALSQLRADPTRNAPGISMFGDPLDTATKGMTPAQRDMIRSRYRTGTGRQLNEEQMQNDLAIMLRQLNDPQFGTRPTGILLPAQIASGGVGGLPGFAAVQGGYVNEEAAKEAKRKAKEAHDKAIEAAEKALEAANIELRRMKEIEKRAPDSPGVLYQLSKITQMETNVNRLKGDPNAQRLLNLGLEGAGAENAREIEKARKDRQDAADKARDEANRAREEAARERAAATEYYAENARSKYGLFSRTTLQRAQEAQEAAEAATPSGIDLLKLKEHATGPLKLLSDAQREAISTGSESVRSLQEANKAWDLSFADEIIGASDARVRGRQRGLRPNIVGADDRQESILTGNVADIQRTIDVLTRNTPEASDKIVQMRDRLADANAALVDFRDQMGQQRIEETLKRLGDKYDVKISDIENKNLPVVGETERQAAARERQLLQAKADLAQKRYEDLFALKFGVELGGMDPKKVVTYLEQADVERKRTGQSITAFDRERQRSQYEQVAGPLKTALSGSLMDFLHGRGGFEDVLRAGGDSIVNSVLERQVSALTDPLIPAITNQVTSTGENTKAIGNLTSAITGGAASGAGGTVTGAGGGRKGLLPGKGDRYLTEALAGYSVFASGQAQGSNLGSVLGAALAGGAIAGPIGALVGGGLNLLGGLFHQKARDPLAEDKSFNPAIYNAPSDYEYNAYRYRATGKLPDNIGLRTSLTAAPVVNVYLDQVKTAVRTEVGQQLSLSRAAQTNVFLDMHGPV
jgi:hypothetical protein